MDILVVGVLWPLDCEYKSGTMAEGNRVEGSASNDVLEAGHASVALDKAHIVMVDAGTLSLEQNAFASMEEVAGIVALEARP